MKIAISTLGDSIESLVDRRFGRASNFIIYDLDNGTYEVVDNKANFNSTQGAGIQAAQTVARYGVGAVITGNVGPNAYRTLSAAGIKIYCKDGGTVQEAIEDFKSGKLQSADGANVEGHWM